MGFFGSDPADLCRDSKAETRNSLKPGATDGYCRRPGTPWQRIIEPLSHPQPLSTRPLSITSFLVHKTLQDLAFVNEHIGSLSE
jgi:hypothetical protein